MRQIYLNALLRIINMKRNSSYLWLKEIRFLEKKLDFKITDLDYLIND